jgi:ABC-type nickel/cobalt efflux system permease component RcnA
MLTLFSIVVIGFFLGMRHATDPDHVIAVTTIVSRQRSIGRAALIGAFWGLGHTITIFGVGTAIILFNVVIPTRLGLSMEFSVSLMLIVLGLWNLVGFLRSAPGAGAPVVHSHSHTHGGLVHSHTHAHPVDELSSATPEDGLAKTGVCGCGPAYSGNDSKSNVGDYLPSNFWHRNHRGNDGDYHEHRFHVPVRRKSLCDI